MKGHVEDAQLLLSYAAEEGIQLDDNIVDTIIKSKYYVRHNDFDQNKEMEFWRAFNGLSKIIQPVSIASLKATRGREKTFFKHNALFFLNKSEAARTVCFYQTLTLVVLVSLLAVQIYWLIGSIIITKVTHTPSFEKEIGELERLKDTYKDMEKPDVTRIIAGIIKNYENRVNNINSEKEVYYIRLQKWRSTFFAKWLLDDHNELLLSKELLRIEKLINKTEWLTNNNYEEAKKEIDELFKDALTTYKDEIKKINDEKTEEFFQKGYIEAEQAAQLILQPIQQYILPLLYGWIGALAYVLRSINREIAEITYTHQSKEHYRLRAQLGVLSGLAVGWFFSVEPEHYIANSSFSFGNLSPLALSFLAGYSVELLFSAMDKIVETFSANSASSSSR